MIDIKECFVNLDVHFFVNVPITLTSINEELNKIDGGVFREDYKKPIKKLVGDNMKFFKDTGMLEFNPPSSYEDNYTYAYSQTYRYLPNLYIFHRFHLYLFCFCITYGFEFKMFLSKYKDTLLEIYKDYFQKYETYFR